MVTRGKKNTKEKHASQVLAFYQATLHASSSYDI